ncbi:hypothetical protein AB4440_14855 [Vibrio splendidus]|uniref:hypothetical protein n=1 Tax=Vibrio splendidus TaxID=29497 RepID=UPI000C82F913|nr:hypothetical protein [Vibrio splendidus]PMP02587.1 hypothetical protein BCS97_04580 [Vibrio splendidus]PMP17655.1 hypothetical protein BCS89_22645 [Vibrio splendidus]PMP34829.1 hypothetical protein BCS88_09815 [Vibrio splendidus]PMP36198.1 hypothetical protein BCS87_17550 [Vibrio splendidus]PMP51289.1 hypothetical protein BCS85_05380 [Vibrio splendidus]
MNTHERNQTKVTDTKSLLLEVITNPLIFKDSEDLKLALKSQGALAKYTDNERGIGSCSLNTFKTISNSLLEKGFSEIDDLRINAKNAIEVAVSGKPPPLSTRQKLQHKVDDLECQLSAMKKNNFHFSVIISELRGELKRMSESSDNIDVRQKTYEEINRKIESKLNYTLHGKL